VVEEEVQKKIKENQIKRKQKSYMVKQNEKTKTQINKKKECAI
jgi:hypothetical protein